MDYQSAVIISDFDGTIALQDVNDTIHFTFGDEKTHHIEELYKKGKIGVRESLQKHYQRLHMPQPQFSKFVKENIEIDPYFKHFYEKVKDNDVEFAIVSGGFINYIETLFDHIGLEIEHPIYANRLHFKNTHIEIEFLHQIDEVNQCHREFGVCGNCKYKIIEKYKNENKPVIYIGDGYTDRCVAEEVDLLLAKKDKALAQYCRKKGLNFMEYRDFADLIEIIFKEQILC